MVRRYSADHDAGRCVRRNKMTKREFVNLIIKVFGIYLATLFIRSIPPLFIQFTVDMSAYVRNRPAYLAANVIHTALPLVLAWFFLFRGSIIAAFIVRDDTGVTVSSDSQSPHAQLSFWIVLIGLYCLVSSSGELLHHVVRFFSYRRYSSSDHMIQFSTRALIPSIVSFALSLLFVFKSHLIEKWIKGKDTQQSTGG